MNPTVALIKRFWIAEIKINTSRKYYGNQMLECEEDVVISSSPDYKTCEKYLA
jgi:hypothetical protein